MLIVIMLLTEWEASKVPLGLGELGFLHQNYLIGSERR